MFIESLLDADGYQKVKADWSYTFELKGYVRSRVPLTKAELGRLSSRGRVIIMIKNIPYFKYIECADFIYSVDSVVITFSFEQEIAEKIFSSLDYIHGLFSCIDIKSDVELLYQRIVFETNYNSTNYKNLKSHIAISRGLDGTANGFIHFNPNRLFQSEKAYDEIKQFAVKKSFWNKMQITCWSNLMLFKKSSAI